MNSILIFIGPPACGKGTQSALLQTRSNFKAISTGDMIRDEIKSDSTLGQEMNSLVKQGLLIGDDLICKMVSGVIAENLKNNLILDGFPRTIEQAEFFTNLINNLYPKSELKDIICAIDFDLPEHVLIKRMVNRITCEDCGTIYNSVLNPSKIQNVCDNCTGSNFTKRTDDNTETAKIRIDQYKEKTKPLLNYFQKHKTLSSINANSDIEEIYTQLEKFINSKTLAILPDF